MDCRPRTLQFYRDGVRLEGAVAAGFPAGVRIAADCVLLLSTVTLAFPPARLRGSTAHTPGLNKMPQFDS